MQFNDDAPHVKQAYIYAQHVVNGHKLACKWERLACKRFLNDLEKAENGEFAYTFDVASAERPCKFIEMLPHVKGRWAAKRELFVLQPWQCFIVCNIFGWLRSDNTRRFRFAFLLVPRKNGKSALMAAIGLYALCVDPDVMGDHGAEIVSGATTEQQAWYVFGQLRGMAERSPALVEHFGVEVNAKNLNVRRTASKADPIIGQPGDGGSVTCAIIDEHHEHLNNDLADTLITGMGARLSPLVFFISTAGDRHDGPCFETQKEHELILEGTVIDDARFAIIYSVDEGDDWTTEESLIKANPNYGVSVSDEFLQAQLVQAIRSPVHQNPFKRKHLNIWVGAAVAFFNMESWSKCAADLNEDDYVNDPCYFGVDLSSTTDLTAIARVYVRDQGGKDHFYVFVDCYLPEETVMQPSQTTYQGWHSAGHLTATDGAEIDLNFIQAEIERKLETVPAREIAYDPWHAKQLAQNLEARGAVVVEYRPTRANMNEAMMNLYGAVESGRFHFDGHPILTYCAGNLVSNVDYQGNVFPAKADKKNKIDAIVATLMAVGRAIHSDAPTEYDVIFA